MDSATYYPICHFIAMNTVTVGPMNHRKRTTRLAKNPALQVLWQSMCRGRLNPFSFLVSLMFMKYGFNVYHFIQSFTYLLWVLSCSGEK